MRKRQSGKSAEQASGETPKDLRERIICAAFTAFSERGYTGTSTLEIARRAKVSKRDLYSIFDNKQAMLSACISERSGRMRRPLDLPAPQDQRTLEAILQSFGAAVLREVCTPEVICVYRLALAETGRASEVARTLDSNGRGANRAALTHMLTQAQKSRLIGSGDPAIMAANFTALLFGDLLMRLLLRVIGPPTPADIQRKSNEATRALLTLYPPPR
jgi:AcrR family transcriptional regulator